MTSGLICRKLLLDLAFLMPQLCLFKITVLSDTPCAKRVMPENSAQAGKKAVIANLSNTTGSLIKSHFCFQEYYNAPSTATSTWAGGSKK